MLPEHIVRVDDLKFHVTGGTLKWRREHGKQRRQVRIVTFEDLLKEIEKTTPVD